MALLACESPRFTGNHIFRPTSAETVSSPVAYDFDHDGRGEIVLGSFDGKCYLLDDSLRDLSGWPQHCPGGFFSSPALWDSDHDGTLEVFIGGNDGKLHGWHFNGAAVSGFPVDLGFQVWSSPVIVADAMIAIGGNGKMFLFDGRGNSTSGWPQPFEGWASASYLVTPWLAFTVQEQWVGKRFVSTSGVDSVAPGGGGAPRPFSSGRGI